MSRWIALSLAGLMLICGCTRTSLSPIAEAKRVFVIVMENHSYEEALQGDYTAKLVKQAGVATNYHAITHPSVPNYLAITSGQTWGVDADIYRALPMGVAGPVLVEDSVDAASGQMRRSEFLELLRAEVCRTAEDALTGTIYAAAGCPWIDHWFAYYGGRCPSNVVPFSDLSQDLKTTATRFSWIGPDTCHDQHDCSTAAGDDWLRQTVGMITSSPAWQADAVLFITWDEDSGSADNQVLTLVLRPDVKHRVSAVSYDHYSLLATIEDILGVPRLANAATAKPMRDLVA